MGRKKLTDVTENTIECAVLNSLGDLRWGQSAVDAEEVCGVTSNVRSGHGSSRDGIGPPIIPSGSDVQAGGPDFDGGTIIREAGLCIIESRSGDGDRFLNTGRRVVARVIVTVPGGYGDGNTSVVKLKVGPLVSGVAVTFHPLGAYRFHSLVEAVRNTPTQAHGSNRGVASVPCLLGDPVNASDTVFW